MKIPSETFLNGLQDKTMRNVRVILAAVLLLAGFCAAGPLGGGGGPIDNAGVPGSDLLRAADLGIAVELVKPYGKSEYFSPSADTATARGATLIAAKTAASSGDTIYVGPGSYATTETLAKNGVNWYFDPGASVTVTDAHVFTDGGSAMSFTVSGSGDFNSNRYVFYTEHADTLIVASCRSITSTASALYGAIGGSAGTLFINATHRIYCEYDAILSNGATLYVTVPLMEAGDNAVEVSSIDPIYLTVDRMWSHSEVINGSITGYWRIKEIISESSSAVIVTGGNGILDFDYMVSSAATVMYAQGSCVFKNGTIKTTSNSARPLVYIEGEGVTFQNVNIVGHPASTYSISSNSDPYSVTFLGVISVNKPIDPAIVIGGPGIYYDSSTEVMTIQSLIPRGVILMWSGSIASIPSGWVLCDGTNGTPDLRNRFVAGASTDQDGVAKSNVGGSLAQSGGASTHFHTATITLDFADDNVASGTDYSNYVDGTTDESSSLPPWYALAYIMKL